MNGLYSARLLTALIVLKLEPAWSWKDKKKDKKKDKEKDEEKGQKEKEKEDTWACGIME